MGRFPPRWVPGAFPKFIRLIELGMVVDTSNRNSNTVMKFVTYCILASYGSPFA